MSIKITEEIKNPTFFTKLNFNITNTNFIIVNTLRRVIMQYIPIFGFDYKTIKINYNTSVFNNDYMRLRISQFPIINFKNDINTLDMFFDLINKKELENLPELVMTGSFTNKLTDNLTITSDDCKYYFNNKECKTIYPEPIPIIKLKPGEKFSFSVKSNLFLALHNDIYSPVSACAYEQLNATSYNFMLEGLGQLSERELIKRACQIVKIKLEKIDEYINNEHEDVTSLVLQKDNHTMGNLISYYLQQHKNIVNAGFLKDHLLKDEVEIKFGMKSGNFKTIFKEISAEIIGIFTKIENAF